MRYFSTYIPREYVADVKQALLPALQDLQQSIFRNNLPGHENEDSRWGRYVAFRDLYLCLEGADKEEKEISVTPFETDRDDTIIMHREAEFNFEPKDDSKDA